MTRGIMINILWGKYLERIATIVVKIDTFVASYEEKDSYSIHQMVFTVTVYNI